MESTQNNALPTFNSTELVVVDHGDELRAESDAVIAILTAVSVGLILFFTCLCCAIVKYKTLVWDTNTHHHELQMKDSIEQSQKLSLRSAASSSNANNLDIEPMDESLQEVKIQD